MEKAARTVSAGAVRGLDALRTEVTTLKKPVLLRKVKRELLRREKIGPAERDALLADYLKAILNLTGTSAGPILIHEDSPLVFRSSCGPGSQPLVGRGMPLEEGLVRYQWMSNRKSINWKFEGCCQKFHEKREAKHETAEVAEENQE